MLLYVIFSLSSTGTTELIQKVSHISFQNLTSLKGFIGISMYGLHFIIVYCALDESATWE